MLLANGRKIDFYLGP